MSFVLAKQINKTSITAISREGQWRGRGPMTFRLEARLGGRRYLERRSTVTQHRRRDLDAPH